MEFLLQENRYEDVYPLLEAMASTATEPERVRAVVYRYPGGAPELYLERWHAGDEAEPWTFVERVQVEHDGGELSELSFAETHLEFVSHYEWDDENPTRRWQVDAAVGSPLGTQPIPRT